MEIDNKFSLGQPVFLVHDPVQEERMVTAIQVNANGLLYRTSIQTTESWHYDKHNKATQEDITRTDLMFN